MEASPYGNLCAALCIVTKTTANITRTTDDYGVGKRVKKSQKSKLVLIIMCPI